MSTDARATTTPPPTRTTIFTLTLNPAIDMGVTVEKVMPEHKLRCEKPRREPGGGGLNVTRAIAELGGASTAVFPAGGKTGDLLKFLVGHSCSGVACDQRPVPVLAPTRENVIVNETSSGHQYRFNMPGAELSEEEARACLAALVDGVKGVKGAGGVGGGGLAVVSGSLPPGVKPPFIRTVIQAVRAAGGRVVVDSSGPALREALDAEVCMVKPNRRELADLLAGEGGGMNPDEADPAVVGAAAIDLARKHNITYVLVSMGGDGAVLAMKDGYAYCQAPKVEVKSATGAGDSMVAAAVLAIERGRTPEAILREGVAAGAAAALTPGTELLKRPDFERLRDALPVPEMVRSQGARA